MKLLTYTNNGVHPINIPLYEGRYFGSYHEFRVLWPPFLIPDEKVHPDIYKVLSAFNLAIDRHPDLRTLYNRVKEEGLWNKKKNREEEWREEEEEKEIYLKKKRGGRKKNIPEEIKNANTLLKKAANRMSLSFRLNEKLLFLGDLESEEIETVTKSLCNEYERSYEYIITAHHGTHSHSNVNLLNCETALTSVGERLFTHLKQEYSYASKDHKITWLHGDIWLS